MKNADSFLTDAIRIMEERGKFYDLDRNKQERSMATTVACFNKITGKSITTEQGWMFMALLKAVRSQQGEYNADNYTDGAAYFALAGEEASK